MLSSVSFNCWCNGQHVFPYHLLPDVGKHSGTEAITLSLTVWACCRECMLPTCTVVRLTEKSSLVLNIFNLLLFLLVHGCLTDQYHDTRRVIPRMFFALPPS